jgi:hypothetical protein
VTQILIIYNIIRVVALSLQLSCCDFFPLTSFNHFILIAATLLLQLMSFQIYLQLHSIFFTFHPHLSPPSPMLQFISPPLDTLSVLQFHPHNSTCNSHFPTSLFLQFRPMKPITLTLQFRLEPLMGLHPPLPRLNPCHTHIITQGKI